MNKKIWVGFAAILTAIVAFLPMLNNIGFAGAEVAEDALAKTSKAALIMDSDTGTVVFQKNENDRLPIASMVKIMTLLQSFDEIEKRGISIDTMITASENAAAMGGSQAFLDADSQYRLDELLKSIVVASANDSCVAVAEYLYGSVDAFVDAMNGRAAELGLENTHFVNCTGLPKAGQYSCAKDVSVMFKELIEHEKFFEYANVWMYNFEHPSGRVTELTNTNKLIKFYNGCDAGKTGYTDEARSCITVTAKRGDTRLICVTIGAENSKTRNKEVSEMLNYAFSNYKTVYAVKKGDFVGEYSVFNGKTDSVKAEISESVTAFVKLGDNRTIDIEYNISDIKAPVAVGDVVGEAVVYLGGEKYKTVPVVASTECEKKGYVDILQDFISEW